MGVQEEKDNGIAEKSVKPKQRFSETTACNCCIVDCFFHSVS